LIEAYIRNKLESRALAVSFSSQYSHMIARRRELNTFSSITSYADFSHETVEELELYALQSREAAPLGLEI